MSNAKTMKLELSAEFPYEEESSHAGLGSTRKVGWAVKGTPFRVSLKVSSKAKLSLSHAQVHLQLLAEETYAPIEIGDRALTWEHSSSGSLIYCDVRLLVLSTQLAKSCVLIKATVVVEGQKIEALSSPIKVVSKPEQIRKKRKEANQDPELDGSKKRARSEDVLVELRQLQAELTPALNALRQQQQSQMGQGPLSSFRSAPSALPFDISDEESLLEETTVADDDDETSTNITTDDERGTESQSAFDQDVDDDPSSRPSTRASLTSTFESMLSSFAEAMNEEREKGQESNPSLSAAPLSRIKASVNFLGLDQTSLMNTDDYP